MNQTRLTCNQSDSTHVRERTPIDRVLERLAPMELPAKDHFERYLRSVSPANNWWAVAYDRDTKLCTRLGVAPQARESLASRRAAAFRLVTSVTLPGGTSAFVRILASDGVNTSQGDAGPFIVAGKVPTALLNAPADGAVFAPGQTVIFVGDGFDPEDGSLPDERLVWSSDRDGTLGSGRTLERADLSEGTHIITLTVGDSQGNQATASITLRVSRPGLYLPLIVR